MQSKTYFVLFLLFTNFVFSQNEKQIAFVKIKTAKGYKQQVDALLDYGQIWFQENPDSAQFYYKKANELAVKNNYNEGRFVFYECYIDYLGYLSQDQKALEMSFEYNKLANKIKDYKNIARSLNVIGYNYNYLGEFEKAIEYYQKSILIYKKINMPHFAAKVNNLIATSFYSSNNLIKAKEYCTLTINQAKLYNDKKLEADALNILVGCLINSKKTNDAENPCKRAIFIYDSLKFMNDKNAMIIDLSKIYFEQKKTELAIKTISEVIKIFEKTKNDYYLVNSYAFLAKYLIAKSELFIANNYLETAMKICKKNDMQLHLPLVYETLIELKKAQNDFETAFFYKEKYQTHLDSLNSNDLKKQLQSLDMKFQTKQKETQIKLQTTKLKQKTTNNILLIGGISALALLSLLGFLNYRNRQRIDQQKITELEQEKQLTAVSSIMQGQEEERSRMAKDLHDGLGGMLSGIKLNLSAMRGNQILQEADANIFSRSIDQLDSAIKEMRRVAHNMMPEALLKFGLHEAVQDFCDGINQAGTVKMTFKHFGETIPSDQSLQVILYRIIQELSNNAIKYAKANSILIQMTKHDNGITLTVEDDGQGFDVATLEKNKGTGLNNVISRVNYLKGKFTIDSEKGKGTSCFVEIPN